MKRTLFLLAVAAMSAGMTLFCHNADASANIENGIALEKKPSTATAKPYKIQLSEQQQAFVNDNNAFTLKFLKTVNDEDKSGKSFIYSPLSITYVLSMVNAAAEGNTQRELEQTLGFREGGIKAVNDFCKNLILNLPRVDSKVQLRIANAIFVNKNYKLKNQFQKDLLSYYQAKAEAMDFSSANTLKQINQWCSQKTNGMIPRILNKLNPEAVSYLLNAIYFKANWAEPFEKKLTRNGTFTMEDGTVELPMMLQRHSYSYVKNDIFAAVDLPYGNEQWSMMVMLPEEGKTTEDVINYLAKDGMSFLSMAKTREVHLKLPRFETESTTDNLIATLKQLGINKVFDQTSAEIPNMCNGPVYISNMLQKARIKVNESGSEAAAVTEEEVFLAIFHEDPPVTFHADHPFVYVIREASSGVILFVGKFTGK